MKTLFAILCIVFSIYAEDQKYDTLKAINAKIDSVVIADSLALRKITVSVLSATDSVLSKGIRATGSIKADSILSKGIRSTATATLDSLNIPTRGLSVGGVSGFGGAAEAGTKLIITSGNDVIRMGIGGTWGFPLTLTATTKFSAMSFVNTGGSLIVGVERSSTGGLFTGSTAYAGCIGTATGDELQLYTNDTKRMTIGATDGNINILAYTSLGGNEYLKIWSGVYPITVNDFNAGWVSIPITVATAKVRNFDVSGKEANGIIRKQYDYAQDYWTTQSITSATTLVVAFDVTGGTTAAYDTGDTLFYSITEAQ